ncbi:rho-related GTP-binding protein RhoJ-like [Musca autumnalis]|uniref:rho-related GTP-binding protein RhoJ-like n=1 Tax=Musca autumnalis TaxID=221902 RepID=UPI003CEF066D
MSPLIKCVVLGDSGAGKTSLLKAYIDKTYCRNPPPTMYVEYAVKTTTAAGLTSNLILCDATGVEDYNCVKRLCYPKSDVFLICCSVYEENCLENIRDNYLYDIRMCCPDVPIILVATKIDLRDTSKDTLSKANKRILTFVEGQQIAKAIGAEEYLECSALNGTGVAEVFRAVATCGLNYRLSNAEHNYGWKCSLL